MRGFLIVGRTLWMFVDILLALSIGRAESWVAWALVLCAVLAIDASVTANLSQETVLGLVLFAVVAAISTFLRRAFRVNQQNKS